MVAANGTKRIYVTSAGDAPSTDLTAELLAVFVAATAEQKLNAIRVLRGAPAGQVAAPEPYLTLSELAARLNFHPSTLWRWQIPKHELAGRPRFLASEVVAYLGSQNFKLRVQDLRERRRASR